MTLSESPLPSPSQLTAVAAAGSADLLDTLQRPLRDLRISVTDRCNLRCRYCMPSEHFGSETKFLNRKEVLRFEEIVRVVKAALPLGLRKVRITGGEPLLRRDLLELVRQLRRLPVELAMTTNGLGLAPLAAGLREAGLGRVSVSLDALDPVLYRQITGSTIPVARVTEGIEQAEAVGLLPVKVNAVIRRGCNEHQVVPLVERFIGRGIIVRFIEFMDVGATNGWNQQAVVTSAEILRILQRRFALEPIASGPFETVTERWRVRGTHDEVGVISSVSHPFCRGCTRLRLAANGIIHRCLFASDGFDLRPVLRNPERESLLGKTLAELWQGRSDRYSELRAGIGGISLRPEMSYIGG